MILIVTPKDKYATNRLKEEAAFLKVPVMCIDVQELASKDFAVDVNLYDLLYVRSAYPYFRQIINLAKKFTAAGKYVVDGEFILSGFKTSKWEMYQKLLTNDLPIPQTSQLVTINSQLATFPLVLKWQYGFGGNNVFLVRNQKEYNQNIAKHPIDEWLEQEYVPATWEYKIVTAGYKSLPVVLGFKPENNFKIDIYKYAIFSPDQKPEVVSIAERAARVMGCELAKVDILEKFGRLFILEVNRNPGLLPFEPYSRLNVAGDFIKYISNNIGKRSGNAI